MATQAAADQRNTLQHLIETQNSPSGIGMLPNASLRPVGPGVLFKAYSAAPDVSGLIALWTPELQRMCR